MTLPKLSLDPLALDNLEQGAKKINDAIQVLNDTQGRVADVLRDGIHSGVLDFDPNWKNAVLYNILRGSFGLDKGTPNHIYFGATGVVINGFKVDVKDPAKATSSYPWSSITLPEPPTFGERWDLAFLEAWFPQDNSEKMSWRIRTVAGVDFGKFPEGLGYSGNEYLVSAQGGNISPTSTNDGNNVRYNAFYSASLRGASSITAKKTALDDVGLYIAGDGTPTSIDALKTADGFVYAIPLFKIRRRNSGGFRKDNPNGARDYFTLKPPSSISFQPNVAVTGDFSNATNLDKVKVGDIFRHPTQSYDFKILAINGTSLTIISATYSGNTSADWGLVSDRPDGLFANIIDASDLEGGDLRHKVSLTGYTVDQLIEEAHDKIQKGELRTNKPTTLWKDQYGLLPAPKLLKQELVPKKRKGNDGVERELVNLLGAQGKKEYSFNAYAGGSHSPIINIALKAGKKYLIVFNLKSTATTYLRNTAYFENADATITQQIIGNQDVNTYYKATGFKYWKFTPDKNTAKFGWSYQNTNAEVKIDNISIFEVDQATYDKIDVDAEFTGDKLAQKFPYVDSYPNFAENLLNIYDPNLFVGTPVYFGYKNGRQALIFPDNTASYLGGGITLFSTVGVPGRQYKVTYQAWRSASSSWYFTFRYSDGSSTNYWYGDSEALGYHTSDSSKALTSIELRSTGNGNAYVYLDSFRIEVVGTDTDITLPAVPFGRWYTPDDFFNSFGSFKLTEKPNAHRTIMSDALTTIPSTDLIQALDSYPKHLVVTQATQGQWSANDTIKIKSEFGVVHAPLDGDTALVRVIESVDTTSAKLSSVSGIVVGDSFEVFRSDGAFYATRNVTEINGDIVKFSGGMSGSENGFMVEKTTSSSSPVVTATGIAGTWAGLGTKEATYTITTPPTDNKATIKIESAITYPSGKGISQVPSEVLEGEYNGQKLVKVNGNVVIKDNFAGKVSGSTDANPHKAFGIAASGLQNAPSFGGAAELTTSYSLISALDGSVYTVTNNNSGVSAQQGFSKNLIEIAERKFGEGFFDGCITVADKVARLKDPVKGLAKIIANWHGFGSSVGGNKATVNYWSVAFGAWVNNNYHNLSTVSKLTSSITTTASNGYKIVDSIDANGFVHFLAYAEPSDGVTASVISTEYFEIELELAQAETGYTVLAPEDPFPKLSENLLTQNQALPVDTASFIGYAGSALSIDSIGTVKSTGSSGSGILVPLINTNFVPKNTYATFSFRLKATAGAKLAINYFDGTTIMGGKSVIGNGEFQTVSFTVKAGNGIQNFYIVFNGDYPTSGTDTFYASHFKVELNSVTTAWAEGRKKKMIFNTLGKVKGSTFEVPHRVFTFGQAKDGGGLFPNPTTLLAKPEASQIHYDAIAKDDASVDVISTAIVGEHACQLIEWDLEQVGMSYQAIVTAMRKFTTNWTGFGEGDNAGVVANGATMKIWNDSNGSWSDFGTPSTASTPTLMGPSAVSSLFTRYVTKGRKIYFLVHSTNPSGAVNPAKLTVGYNKIEVEFADYVDLVKSNIVKVRPETKEIKLAYSSKANKIVGQGNAEDQVAVLYKYIPFQGELAGTIDALLKRPGAMFLTSEGTAKAKSFTVSAYDKYKNLIAKLANDFKSSDFEGVRLTTETAEVINAVVPSIVKVPLISPMMGSSAGYTDERTGLLGSSSLGYQLDKSALESKGKYYNYIIYLVVVKGEIMLAMKRRTSSLIGESGVVTGTPMLFRLDGRPLIKGVA